MLTRDFPNVPLKTRLNWTSHHKHSIKTRGKRRNKGVRSARAFDSRLVSRSKSRHSLLRPSELSAKRIIGLEGTRETEGVYRLLMWALSMELAGWPRGSPWNEKKKKRTRKFHGTLLSILRPWMSEIITKKCISCGFFLRNILITYM